MLLIDNPQCQKINSSILLCMPVSMPVIFEGTTVSVSDMPTLGLSYVIRKDLLCSKA